MSEKPSKNVSTGGPSSYSRPVNPAESEPSHHLHVHSDRMDTAENAGNCPPPAYSAPESNTAVDASTSRLRSLSSTPGLPPIDFSRYVIPGSTLSADENTLTISSPELASNPIALLEFIKSQAAVPPRPQVRIRGSHGSYGNKFVDFDIRLNLIRYIVPPPPSRWNYVKLVEPTESVPRGQAGKTVAPRFDGGVEGWARRFCNDPAHRKSFTLERQVSNWDTTLLEGRIRTLLAALRYQGQVSITFPLTHSLVVVEAQPKESGFIAAIMSLVKETKRYSVVRSIWPYANTAPGDSRGAATRECAVQSEAEWWEVWNQVIARAVLSKRQGWVTLDDLMEQAMSMPREIRAKDDWGANGI